MSIIEILLIAILGLILFLVLLWTVLLVEIYDNIKIIKLRLKETNDLLERVRSRIYTRI